MTTKNYLRQISRLNRMIQNKLTEISRLREMAQSISAINTDEKVQSTPNHDAIGASIAKICDMESQVTALIDELVEKKQIIVSQIDEMDDEIQYEILESYYVEGMTFEQIAAKLSYSFRHVTRIHGLGLRSFERKFGNLYLKK